MHKIKSKSFLGNTANIHIFLGFIFFILTWIFVGVFRDDEFFEPQLFTKHKPNFKINFYSPIGMSDQQIEYLSEDQLAELNAFNEFVIKQNIQFQSQQLWFLPEVLIQLTLTFLIIGVYKSIYSTIFKIWKTALHFLICLMITGLGLAFILTFDRLSTTVCLGGIILMINYWVLKSLNALKIKFSRVF